MNAPVIIVDSSTADPLAELWFVEPAGFLPLPLDALLPDPNSSAEDRLRAAAAPLLDAAPDEAFRQQFIAAFATGQQLLAALREVGTVHCSVGLHRDDVSGMGGLGGVAVVGPLFSLFTISWRETAAAPRSVTAARAVTAAGGHAGVEFVELPAGPATFSESTSAPGSGSGLPQRSLLQLHAHLPHPDCRRLVVLTLTTTAPARREEYRAILRAIAGSVSFESPG
ncbi:hypothetical protein [Streptomyces hirsutus]|uniref:hypothetical protein n=1 Tax=Streptomyces hirsutus TaxID=35620 RepID=UPI0007C7A73A|nr:hypothetical protein [Streptomyces hirsutus]